METYMETIYLMSGNQDAIETRSARISVNTLCDVWTNVGKWDFKSLVKQSCPTTPKDELYSV